MLFSMLLSYHFAWYGGKTYALLTAFSIILTSFLSTLLGYAYFLGALLYPIWLLSFPFFLTPVWRRNGNWYITAYNTNFFTLKIATVPREIAIANNFLLFSLVYVAGAMFGYWMHKRLLWGSLERRIIEFFFRSTILSLITCYLITWVIMLFAGGQYPFIAQIIYAFCVLFFWAPAVIATAIYGICDGLENLFKSLCSPIS